MFTQYKEEVTGPGKYEGETVMTPYVDQHLDSLGIDDEENWGDGSGQVRIGKRILYWDERGFVSLFRFQTEHLAVLDMIEMRKGLDS